MKIVDNFDLIASHMSFDSDDEFYFVQILVRSKDGHTVNGNNKNRLIKFYTIRSVEELMARKYDIIGLCQLFNARAYIHPTKRSFKAVGKAMLKEIVENIVSDQYQPMKRAYSTACGKSFITKDKKYVIDIDDNPAMTEYAAMEITNSVMNYINKECEPLDKYKVEYEVPTAHGRHLITSAFNVARFNQKFPEIAVQKNNPTLLYYEVQEETGETQGEDQAME